MFLPRVWSLRRNAVIRLQSRYSDQERSKTSKSIKHPPNPYSLYLLDAKSIQVHPSRCQSSSWSCHGQKFRKSLILDDHERCPSPYRDFRQEVSYLVWTWDLSLYLLDLHGLIGKWIRCPSCHWRNQLDKYSWQEHCDWVYEGCRCQHYICLVTHLHANGRRKTPKV